VQLTPDRHLLDRRARMIMTTILTGNADDLLSTRVLARMLGVGEQWLEIGRSTGRYGPPYLKLSSRCVRYRRDRVLAWLEERAHASTAEYPTPKPRPGSRPPGRPRKMTIQPTTYRRTRWPEGDGVK
jgi:hypothetical protein